MIPRLLKGVAVGLNFHVTLALVPIKLNAQAQSRALCHHSLNAMK